MLITGIKNKWSTLLAIWYAETMSGEKSTSILLKIALPNDINTIEKDAGKPNVKIEDKIEKSNLKCLGSNEI